MSDRTYPALRGQTALMVFHAPHFDGGDAHVHVLNNELVDRGMSVAGRGGSLTVTLPAGDIVLPANADGIVVPYGENLNNVSVVGAGPGPTRFIG